MEAVQSRGGLLELSDLGSHQTRRTSSITTTYRGLQIHEIPPPTQVRHNMGPHCCRCSAIRTSSASLSNACASCERQDIPKAPNLSMASTAMDRPLPYRASWGRSR